MSAKSHRDARCLFVISKDFGQLSMAMQMLQDQEFASRARLLLPPCVYAPNADSLPVPTTRYESVEDILEAVDEHGSDLVFLFTAFRFIDETQILRKATQKLIRDLRERGCRVVTSDPLIGLSGTIKLRQCDTRMLLSQAAPLLRWLGKPVYWLRRNEWWNPGAGLEDLAQVYPTSKPEIGGEDPVRRFAFHNPRIIRSDETAVAGSGDPPTWLFLLSPSEMHCQHRLSGSRALILALSQMLQDALRADRKATLIAPSEIVEVLEKRLPDEVEMLPLCSFVELDTRLLAAEYVFCWNVFSGSLLPRIANGLPVFFFDRGHRARTAEPFYEAALRTHFGGWSPNNLDQRIPLHTEGLAMRAAEQAPALRAIRERWESSPTPEELLDRLLGEPAVAPERGLN